MNKQIAIKTLDKQGVRKVEIARQINCHRNTVRNIVLRKSIIETQTRNKTSACAQHHDIIQKLLEKKVTSLRIYEILQETHGFSKGYDAVRRYINKNFPKQVEAYGVQVTKPGEEAEIDFGYLGMLPREGDTLVKAWGIAVILSHSRHGYWAITYDQKLATLTRELTNAFEYFGGVPKKLKVDNMKTAILKNQHYELEFNQDFLEFAAHYTTVIVPCTPYHPEQKGKVEASIKYLKNNFIAGRTFKDDRDLCVQLREWRDTYANTRIHGTTKRQPSTVFHTEEKNTLLPLPAEEFAFFNRCVRKVAQNCHIHFENNYYSVPAILVGTNVTVRYDDQLVRIVHEGEQVTLHKRSKEKGIYITTRSHIPDYKVYSETEYQKRYEDRMAQIGEQAHIFFKMLLKSKRNYWGRIVRGVLGMAKEYGKPVVERSLERAMHFNATDLTTIKNIAEKKLYQEDLEPKLSLNKEARESRSLSYYQG
jgi:transposase